jgi:hypothetical protein
MNSKSYDNLRTEAAADMFAEMKTAESAVTKKLDDMVKSGEVNLLSDEEARLLNSFRRFKLRMKKNGEVFKWQSSIDTGVMIAEDTAFVVDPQEVVGAS